MRFTLALIALVLAGPVAASADDFTASADDSVADQDIMVVDQDIELFPLANMDTETNNTLKTSTELGERRAVLVIRAEPDTSLPTSSSSVQMELPTSDGL
jgi:hypothetical protein